MANKSASYNPRTKQFTLFENGKISGSCKDMSYNQKTGQFQQRSASGAIKACYKANNQIVSGTNGRILVKKMVPFKQIKREKKMRFPRNQIKEVKNKHNFYYILFLYRL